MLPSNLVCHQLAATPGLCHEYLPGNEVLSLLGGLLLYRLWRLLCHMCDYVLNNTPTVYQTHPDCAVPTDSMFGLDMAEVLLAGHSDFFSSDSSMSGGAYWARWIFRYYCCQFSSCLGCHSMLPTGRTSLH